MPVQLSLSGISHLAPSLAEQIREAAETSRGREAQFAIEMDDLLRKAFAGTGLVVDERHFTAERRVVWPGDEKERSGFIDRLLFSRLLLEFKAPGVLKPINSAKR